MAFDVTTLLAPPDGSGELDPRWFDWLPAQGSGETQVEAVVIKLEGYAAAAETLLEAAGVAVTDPAVAAYTLWKAYNSLAIEYGRRGGSTTINNEVTQATGSASVKPFADARDFWKLQWNVFVPEAGVGAGSGVSASVRTSFTF